MLASLCMAIYQTLFFSSVTITVVAVGKVVAIGIALILSGCKEWIFLKPCPPIIQLNSTILSITCCVLLFMNQDSVYTDPTGIILALGAGLSFASYTIVSRELVENYDSLSVVAVVFTISGI